MMRLSDLDSSSHILCILTELADLRKIGEGISGRGFGDITDYMRWLGGERRLKDIKGTNTITLWRYLMGLLSIWWVCGEGRIVEM